MSGFLQGQVRMVTAPLPAATFDHVSVKLVTGGEPCIDFTAYCPICGGEISELIQRQYESNGRSADLKNQSYKAFARNILRQINAKRLRFVDGKIVAGQCGCLPQQFNRDMVGLLNIESEAVIDAIVETPHANEVTIRPDSRFGPGLHSGDHNNSFSVGCASTPSGTGAGGASSPARVLRQAQDKRSEGL